VAEPKAPGGVSKALNAAWIRPFLFLIFIVVAWDLTIRLFRIPPYQIPAPGDVVAVLWTDWPELLRQAWPTTYATICGFRNRCRRSRSRHYSWSGSVLASFRK